MGKFERLDTLWSEFPAVLDGGWNDIAAIPWIQFFKVLCLKASSRLKSVVIQSPDFDPMMPTPDWPALSLSDIPDLCLLKLTRLRIVFPIFPTISTADIYRILSSFPALVIFDLVTRLPWQTDFTSLIVIAKGLSKLKELTFGMDAHSLPSPSHVPLLSHGLCSLELIISRMKDLGQFAHYLDKIFHKVQTCDILGSGLQDSIQKQALEVTKRSLTRFIGARADQIRRFSMKRV